MHRPCAARAAARGQRLTVRGMNMSQAGAILARSAVRAHAQAECMPARFGVRAACHTTEPTVGMPRLGAHIAWSVILRTIINSSSALRSARTMRVQAPSGPHRMSSACALNNVKHSCDETSTPSNEPSAAYQWSDTGLASRGPTLSKCTTAVLCPI